TILVEDAERNERHAGLAHQPLAEHAIGFVRQTADVGGEEKRAFAGQRLEAEPFNALSQKVALGLQFVRQLEREIHLVLEPIGNAELQRRRRREGDELVRLADRLDERFGTRHPTDLPPCQREYLS